jgi:hypothetical protein
MCFQYHLLFIKKVDIPASAAYELGTQLPSMQHGCKKMKHQLKDEC